MNKRERDAVAALMSALGKLTEASAAVARAALDLAALLPVDPTRPSPSSQVPLPLEQAYRALPPELPAPEAPEPGIPPKPAHESPETPSKPPRKGRKPREKAPEARHRGVDPTSPTRPAYGRDYPPRADYAPITRRDRAEPSPSVSSVSPSSQSSEPLESGDSPSPSVSSSQSSSKPLRVRQRFPSRRDRDWQRPEVAGLTSPGAAVVVDPTGREVKIDRIASPAPSSPDTREVRSRRS